MNMKFIKTGIFATIDQIWLSLLNLSISIAFIRYGNKSDYGLYMLLFGGMNLAIGFQNALFVSPFATIFPQKKEVEQKPIISFLVWGQVGFSLFVGLIGSAIAIGYFAFESKLSITHTILTGAALFLAILGALTREASRAYQYALGHSTNALIGDLIFGGFLIAGLALMIFNSGVTSNGVLLLTGAAGLLTLIRPILLKTVPSFEISKETAFVFWQYGRWALVGVAISWIHVNALGYTAALVFGLSVVAEITAARLFMMPLVLGLPVWSNLLRPHYSRWFAQGKPREMKYVTYSSTAIGICLVTAYVFCLSLIYSHLERAMGSGYSGLFPMILAWSGFYLVVMVRTTLMANLMVNEAGYKKLSQVSLFGLVLLCPVMWIASKGPAVWLIYSLIAIEIGQTSLVFKWASNNWKGAHSD